MSKLQPVLNFLSIAIMIIMIVFTSIFIYGNINLKNRIIFRIVQQTEMISAMATRVTENFLAGEHNLKTYNTILNYDDILGVEHLYVFKLSGEEAFSGNGATAREKPTPEIKTGHSLEDEEIEYFKKAIDTMNRADFFDQEGGNFTSFIPLISEEGCGKCHKEEEGDLLGILEVSLATGNDFELLKKMEMFIWQLGLVLCLPIGGILISRLIIREKNKLYSDLEKSNVNLNETKSYIQLILDNSKAIIWTTDLNGYIVEFNREAQKLTGYAKTEVVGKDVGMLYADSAKGAELMKSRKAIGDGLWVVKSNEVEFKTKDNKIIYVSLTISPLMDGNANELGAVGICKDISEQKMLHFKLVQSEKLAGIGTLASGIAHEINNPLAGILGMAEAAKDEKDPELASSYIDDIIKYADNASNIVKELSGYSRSARTESTSEVELSKVFASSLKMAKHSASFVSINVVEELEDGCYIQANEGEIQQVLVNLMVNAIHAMGESGTLTLKCFREGSFVNAIVSDTGEGIPEEYLSQIYDPFFTTKPAGKGTGLGLYVVYRIVTKYGGTIDGDSIKGQGTTFTIRFPGLNNNSGG